MSRFPVEAKRFLCDPTRDEFREMIAEMKNARLTRFENYNVQTRVVARSKASTYLVTDHPEEHTDQCITREEGRRIAQMQDEYIHDQEMIVVEGYIGNDPEFRTPARMMIEKANANVAAMQQTLYFPVAESVSHRTLALPFFTRLTEREIDLVCQTLELMMTRRAFARD